MLKTFFLLTAFIAGSVNAANSVSLRDTGKWNFNRLEKKEVVKGNTYLGSLVKVVKQTENQIECSEVFEKFQNEVMTPGLEAGSFGIHGIECDSNSELNEIRFAFQVLFEPMSQNGLPKFEKFLESLKEWSICGASLTLKKVARIYDAKIFRTILLNEVAGTEDIIFEGLLYEHKYESFWEFMNSVNDDIALLGEKSIEKILDYLTTVLPEDSINKLKKDALVKSNAVIFKHAFAYEMADGEHVEYLFNNIQFAMYCNSDKNVCL